MAQVESITGTDLFIIGGFIALFVYWMYNKYSTNNDKKNNDNDDNYDDEYKEVLTSDKYKVKGKYES